MRISTSQIYTNANRNMMDNQSSLADIQNKLSSGKEFTSLAEDPVGANRVVTLNRELAQLEMYQENIDSTRRRLALEETTVSDLNTMMDRVRDLTIQAGNGVLSDEDRVAISYEIEELTEYAAGLMNSRDAKGEYLFSGSQGTTQAYIKNADGRYVYQGDSSNRSVQISSGLYMESTDNGQDLFEALQPALVQEGGEALAGALTGVQVTDTREYLAYMEQQGDLTLSLSESGGIYSYALTDSSNATIASGTYTPGEIVTFSPTDSGMEFDVTMPEAGAALPDETTLKLEENHNILNTMVALAEVLQQPTDGIPAQRAALQQRLASTLTEITMAQEQLSLGSASLGARLNSLDNTEYTNSDFQLMTEGTLSSVQDLDYASAATELSKRQLALEAAYSSFSKIQGLSLFNYIR